MGVQVVAYFNYYNRRSAARGCRPNQPGGAPAGPAAPTRRPCAPRPPESWAGRLWPTVVGFGRFWPTVVGFGQFCPRQLPVAGPGRRAVTSRLSRALLLGRRLRAVSGPGRGPQMLGEASSARLLGPVLRLGGRRLGGFFGAISRSGTTGSGLGLPMCCRCRRRRRRRCRPDRRARAARHAPEVD